MTHPPVLLLMEIICIYKAANKNFINALKAFMENRALTLFLFAKTEAAMQRRLE